MASLTKPVIDPLTIGAPCPVDPQSLPLGERSNEDLMLAHGSGCERSFEELVRRHERGILNYIFRMVQNRQIAEELTQEVFLALVKNRLRYEPTAKFTTYLYTIASNMISKEWLRRKRRPRMFSLFSNWGREDESFHPLEQVADEREDTLARYTSTEITEAVSDALRNLPEHQREAFVLRRFHDLSYQEIAEITSVPVGTAKSRVVRAERALRPHLAAYREYV
jgi:RNA polymerase sigma-70 factor (ECF subfamily)